MDKSFWFKIRALEDQDRAWAADFVREQWGEEFVIVNEEIIYPSTLPGYIARDYHSDVVGLATYRIRGNTCEIVTLNSLVEDQGIGSKLVEVVGEWAEKAGCSRLRVTTTNDNQRAIDFYQKKGFRLREIRNGAVDRARRLKPSIPWLSRDGQPLRDEWEFEKDLSV